MKSKLMFLALGILLIAMGCSKNDDNKGNASDVTTANLAGSYKLTGFSVTVPPVTVDYLDSIPACQRDDIYKLNANNTYDYIDAGTTCSPAGDGSGTWSLVGTTKIIIDGDTANISSFTGTVLTLSITETVGGVTGTATQTLTKQQ